MAISANYPQPIEVNGYSCKNCTDVDYAKKHIDPAHPKDGPYGINKTDTASSALTSPAVTFGGVLAKTKAAAAADDSNANAASGSVDPAVIASQASASGLGTRLNISV